MRKILYSILTFAMLTGCMPREFNESEVEMTVDKGNDGKHPAVGYLAIEGESKDPSNEKCTVTLIRAQYVVTASHCLHKAGVQASGVTVFLKNLAFKVIKTNSPQTELSMRFCLDKGVRGESYCKMKAVDLDFGVMKLQRQIKPSEITPARVGAGTPKNVEIYGYGCRSENGQLGRGQGRMYRGPWNNGKLLLTCTGDSGGPVFDLASGKVVKLMSQGLLDHNNNKKMMDAFANVGAINPDTKRFWIDDLINELGN